MLEGKNKDSEGVLYKSECRDARQIGNDAITRIHPAEDAHSLDFDHRGRRESQKIHFFCQHLIQAEQIKSKDLSNCSLYYPFQSHKPHRDILFSTENCKISSPGVSKML